ncbi:bifunctional YncE family protein/alkaline phosphatase family protein [Sandaracinus amylolyticus]|uniref:bifunctional YncE family protein/alkaline phosphatase family protein n=1 Tax=Sandaracinus amylolyticus TaxID=927083 RepID=UPI001F1F4CE0|nr:alkaline phosphatase family protein [Sandaracinus amylolyticus]UJR81946.1 Hypothetical protein I5071_40110 [Sandaracinus amylolyticus]
MRRTSKGAIALGLVCGALAACGDDDAVIEADAGTDSGPPPSCLASAGDFPTPSPGACSATVLEGATLAAGAEGESGWIIPGGERLVRVGRNLPPGGFPMRVIAVPGTRYVVVSDGGLREETLSVVDLDTLTVVGEDEFAYTESEALFLGLAISDDGRRLWASGGGTDRILAYDLDPATGAITASAARTITVSATEGRAYVSGLALRDDGTLVAALMFEHALALFDSSTGAEIARVPLEAASSPYDVVLSPDGATAFVSLWADSAVAVVDLATRAVTSTIAVGKNPMGLALSPDGATLAVACSDSDHVALIDVATRAVGERFYVVGEDAPRGAAPGALRFGEDGRLYVADALENAIDVLERSGSAWTRVGRVPTMWHPSDVLPLGDVAGGTGSLVFLNARHVGTGANTTPDSTDITQLMAGSMSVVDPGTFDDAQLATWASEIAENNARMSDLVTVECEGGAANDFPIPRPGEGASSRIRHVVLVIRENKTYDAYLGNLTDESGVPHGNGDPALTLIPGAEIDQVIPNTRALALGFALGDNYYSHAEQSVQGHVWTSMGRTTEFVERSWLTTWGRGYYAVPPQGTASPLGYPEEGSGFDRLAQAGVTISNFGEIIGSRMARLDPRYPGLTYSYLPDVDKAEFLGGRVESCMLQSFTYVVLPNDHTRGRDPGAPTPRSMIADNDEAVGIIVDRLSHSTYWPETAIIVIEDDPQDGGDHVDNHRSPLLVISPWARRGHVSSTHVSEASIWRTISLIFGIEEDTQSLGWQRAAPLYDFFTSTPDYTPYDHIERRWPEETNPRDGSADALLSANYDWSRPDEQPGLSRLLWRHFHGGAEPPWPAAAESPFEAEDDD